MTPNLAIAEGCLVTADRTRAPVFYLDVETGGFSAAQNALLSVSLCLVRSTGRLHPTHWLIRPERECGLWVHPRAAAVNGYSPQRWNEAGAVSCEQALEELHRFLRDWLTKLGRKHFSLAAHNAHFDRAFLLAALLRHGYDPAPFEERWFCTCRTMRSQGHHPCGLDDACHVYRVPNPRGAVHQADQDALLGARVLLRQVRAGLAIHEM